MKIKKWITNNIGLKLLALILAIVTWFYTNWELVKIKNKEQRAIISMLEYNVISKKIPVQLTIVGTAQQGYRVLTKDITVEPETIVIVGPEKILRDVNIARTMPIDISNYTKDFKMHIPLAPIADGINLKESLVKVNIPIIKKEIDEVTNE